MVTVIAQVQHGNQGQSLSPRSVPCASLDPVRSPGSACSSACALEVVLSLAKTALWRGDTGEGAECRACSGEAVSGKPAALDVKTALNLAGAGVLGAYFSVL